MKLNHRQLWDRFQAHYAEYPALGLAVDLSRLNFEKDFWTKMEPQIQKAFAAMAELEKGSVANPDENRMVGHYWLRNSSLAPNEQIRADIDQTVAAVKQFANAVHSGVIEGQHGPFKNLLIVGIGGSALGPQFVAHALGHPSKDELNLLFFDNTDPDGMDKVLEAIGSELGQTLTLVISKSGGTKETRNGMLEARAAYERDGLAFSKHAVAVTGVQSELDRTAENENWLARFPMWDWVGGRTSELSAVGLLPAALQAINVDELLAGAEACDEVTRQTVVKSNPAAQLALAWYYAVKVSGPRDMVVLPYKDRLELFSKYLQQLIMESLGKELNVHGKPVHEGISVFGNKGSTDQHAYVQQLRDGPNNFFVTFIEVLKDREGRSIEVEPLVTSGDYLNGFLLGTRQALYEKGRESITITVQEVSPFTIGALIALYERAVGLYASLVEVNAYHQPGVEAGKKAAGAVIDIQRKVLGFLREHRGTAFTLEELAAKTDQRESIESVFKVCEHLAANPERGIRKNRGASPFAASYEMP